MPNHVLNKVTISGSKEDVEKCIEQIITTGENGEPVFSFQSIIPRPADLDIESSSYQDWGLEYVKGGCNELPPAMDIMNDEQRNKCIDLGLKALSNIEKYGYKDWYDWNIGNWGTKWDCYDLTVNVSDECIYLEFSTAWTTPWPVFEKLSVQHPAIEIEVLYADEDLGNNCGSYTIHDGECTDYCGDYKFACELWGYPENEYDD